MPEAIDKIAAPGSDDNGRGARLALTEMEAPTAALRDATGVLMLVAAGIVARREDYAFAPWEGEALEYLALHIHDLAETVSAIRDARPVGWTVGEAFRSTLRTGGEA